VGRVRAGSAGWTHFHLWGWRRVIERVHGHQCPYLAARGPNGALAGILPLVRVKSPLFGHYLVSMPFLNSGGPLGSEDAVRALAAEAVALAERDGVKLLELRSREALPLDLPVSHRKITVVLDLPSGGPDALFQGFKAKLRSQIRRPRRTGSPCGWGRTRSVRSSRCSRGTCATSARPPSRAASSRRSPRSSGRGVVRLRLPRRDAHRLWRGLPVGRRVRADVGVGAGGLQSPLAQHGALLGVPGARGA